MKATNIKWDIDYDDNGDLPTKNIMRNILDCKGDYRL